MEDEMKLLLAKLIEILDDISSFSEFHCSVRHQCRHLLRRLRLLAPLFEELQEFQGKVPENTIKAFVSLMDSFIKAKDLLQFCSNGSKIYMILGMDQMMHKFQELAVQFVKALSEISLDEIDISEEIKEQVELVHLQFARSQKQLDIPDLELFKDFSLVFNQNNEVGTDPAVLQRICAKLNLMSAEDLEKESIALHEMHVASGGNLEDKETMSILLKKFKDFFLAGHAKSNISADLVCSPPGCDGQGCHVHTDLSSQSQNIPDDFRCPISLVLMKDPVTISTGQTYERACIKKWLDSGHRTCPKTQQVLSNTVLIPNHALSSIISIWCEANGVESPKKFGNLHLCKAFSACFVEGVKIDTLFSQLVSSNIEDQQSAAGEIRRLCKHNSENRVCIADAGAIPLLAELLYAHDSLTQEHAVTALLNLSIRNANQRIIVSSGAIPGILHVLKSGNMEARENAAATFFSLSFVDDYKVSIGASGAIPALVALLSEGWRRGKVDAAKALFQLCLYQGNKRRAVRAGAVSLLVTMLTEPGYEMVDEALAVMAVLVSDPYGRRIIGVLDTLPTLVELVMNGSPMSKENAASVILHVCSGDPDYLSEAILLGVKDPLQDLAESGTIRGKQKAAQLLELIDGFGGQHEQSSTAY